jgi:DNA-binding Lrp family transcriptional regulator
MEVARMKANKLAAVLVSELFERRVVDPNAETIVEIAEKTGESERTVSRRIRKLIEAGKVEQVWRRDARNTIQAYRVKK